MFRFCVANMLYRVFCVTLLISVDGIANDAYGMDQATDKLSVPRSKSLELPRSQHFGIEMKQRSSSVTEQDVGYKFVGDILIVDRELRKFGITAEKIREICKEFQAQYTESTQEVLDSDLAGSCFEFFAKSSDTQYEYLETLLKAENVWDNEYVEGEKDLNTYLFLSSKSALSIIKKYGISNLAGFMNYIANKSGKLDYHCDSKEEELSLIPYFRAIQCGSLKALTALAMDGRFPELLSFCYFKGSDKIAGAVHSMTVGGYTYQIWQKGCNPSRYCLEGTDDSNMWITDCVYSSVGKLLPLALVQLNRKK
ncbi:MAG: hypothetical protein LBI26_02040 [Holosporales bacterium]|jgi:hypothetical protein|nr:hypothetical protein [Holosporales bacterium]